MSMLMVLAVQLEREIGTLQRAKFRSRVDRTFVLDNPGSR